MSDIRVTILTRIVDGEKTIVRVFDNVESCEAFIVSLVRGNRMEALEGLGMDSQIVFGGMRGNSKLYTRKGDGYIISQSPDVEVTRD